MNQITLRNVSIQD